MYNEQHKWQVLIHKIIVRFTLSIIFFYSFVIQVFYFYFLEEMTKERTISFSCSSYFLKASLTCMTPQKIQGQTTHGSSCIALPLSEFQQNFFLGKLQAQESRSRLNLLQPYARVPSLDRPPHNISKQAFTLGWNYVTKVRGSMDLNLITFI